MVRADSGTMKETLDKHQTGDSEMEKDSMYKCFVVCKGTEITCKALAGL